MSALRSHEQGFTLIELLVALTIFAVGMLGIAGLQVTSLQQNATANTRSVAVALGQGVLEEILSWPETSPAFATTGADTVWDLDPDTVATTTTFPGAGVYSAVWSRTINTPVPGITQIVVTINGPQGPRNRQLILTGSKRLAL